MIEKTGFPLRGNNGICKLSTFYGFINYEGS